MTEATHVHTLLSDLKQALVFQRELGLRGLSVDDTLLRPKQKITPDLQVDSIAAAPGVASPDEAREEISRMLSGAGSQASGAGPKASAESSKSQGLDLGQSRMVVGAGNPKARLLFVGEASRRDVELLGQPFVGKAGDLLTKMIQAMGLSRSDVYLSNVVKPRSSRTKRAESLNACEPFLRKQIEDVGPEVIVAFGDFSAEILLRDEQPMSKLRGQWREYQGIPVMPTFHPAELLRDASMKKPVWVDLQVVMQRLGLK